MELKGGISGIFMGIFLGPEDPGRVLSDANNGVLEGVEALRSFLASVALASSRAEAAPLASISFCFSSSFDRMGRMSLGTGRGTWRQ